jgi:hypothetical protein
MGHIPIIIRGYFTYLIINTIIVTTILGIGQQKRTIFLLIILMFVFWSVFLIN